MKKIKVKLVNELDEIINELDHARINNCPAYVGLETMDEVEDRYNYYLNLKRSMGGI